MDRKSKEPQKIEQQIPDDSTITAHTLIEELRETNTVITCVLKNYSKLVEKKMYIGDFQKRRDIWIIQLCKADKFDIGFIFSVFKDHIAFAFRNSDNKIFETPFLGIANKTFHLNVEYCELHDPKYKLLKKDNLIMQWAYTARRPESNYIFIQENQPTCYDAMQNSEKDSLCDDLRDLYMSARYYDFILTYNRYEFKVHKLILCSRSAYFYRLSNEDPGYHFQCISHKVDSEKMHLVLLYMYSGCLRDMHVWDMINVFDIACLLEIESLKVICKAYFKANFDFDNLRAIAFVVITYQETDLGEAIVEFLESQRKANPRSKELKRFAVDVLEILAYM